MRAWQYATMLLTAASIALLVMVLVLAESLHASQLKVLELQAAKPDSRLEKELQELRRLIKLQYEVMQLMKEQMRRPKAEGEVEAAPAIEPDRPERLPQPPAEELMPTRLQLME